MLLFTESRYLYIMQHIERQKLIIIIGTAILLGLAAIIITVSIIFSSSGDSGAAEPTYTPPNPTSTSDGTAAGDDTPAEVTYEEGEEDLAPPADMYKNDYSQDEGYSPLPESFDPTASPTEGTVYDDEYVYFTSSRLMCELSNKQTATPKTVGPLKSFVRDLSFNNSVLAVTTKTQLSGWIAWYDSNEGNRVDAKQREELALMYCNVTKIDFTEDEHNH